MPALPRTDTSQLTGEGADTELALRRQLSRLQRQLADAQRELANKDDELAASVEKRVEIAEAYEAAVAELREAQHRLDELGDFRARSAGTEQRLAEAVAAADELAHQLERERTERGAMSIQFDEINAAFDRARSLWKEESSAIEEQHAAQVARLELQKRSAVEAAEAAMKATLERQNIAHEAERGELRGAHERALAALRGELEPKVAEARNLGAEIERLTSELAATRAEHLRELGERAELHKWESQQAAETHAAELEAKARAHAAEINRLNGALETKATALEQADRNAILREQLWEQTTAKLRESEKKLQQEHAEARERAAQADAAKWVVEQRLVTALQQLEKLTAAHSELEAHVEAVEAESRRNHLDRERFAAFLEEGLAMLGAIPPHDEEEQITEMEADEPPPPEPYETFEPSVDDLPGAPRPALDDPAASRTKTPSTPHPNVQPRSQRGSDPPVVRAAPVAEDEPDALPDPTRPGGKALTSEPGPT